MLRSHQRKSVKHCRRHCLHDEHQLIILESLKCFQDFDVNSHIYGVGVFALCPYLAYILKLNSHFTVCYEVKFVLLQKIIPYEKVINYYASKSVVTNVHAEKPPKEVSEALQKALSS
ncbi:hypothetical protein BVRB_6g144330 [Beta vulgaris subsp. vulgaris]|nr:hypothetical protein BVRB_6g144330 [Beta vulgaris subsp. vulgaris]